VLHPDFTVTKTCLTDPVPIGEQAQFEIVISNVGDVELIFNTDEAEIPPNVHILPGNSETYTIYVDAEAGATEVYNEVTVTATLPVEFGLANEMPRFASDVCPIQNIAAFTPGFWKNHWGNPDRPNQKDAWAWVPNYDPYDLVGDVFTTDWTHYGLELEGLTLYEALSLKGGRGIDGGVQIMLRASVAALLNADLNEWLGSQGVPGFPAFYGETPADVILAVNTALDHDYGPPDEGEDAHRQRLIDLAGYYDWLNNWSNIDFDWTWPKP
jgi:hypothetical protein